MTDADAELLGRVFPKILMLHLPDGDGDMKASVTEEYAGRVRRLSKSVASFQVVCYGSWHPLLAEFKPFARTTVCTAAPATSSTSGGQTQSTAAPSSAGRRRVWTRTSCSPRASWCCAATTGASATRSAIC
jgi:hypothetical protein